MLSKVQRCRECSLATWQVCGAERRLPRSVCLAPELSSIVFSLIVYGVWVGVAKMQVKIPTRCEFPP